MRDNFSQAIKRQLAERVAWRCSFPGCGSTTIGPKGEESEGSVNLGEAAHIHAASPLGPRYDPAMSADERASASNGIWMCRNDARLIDADESAFTADTLKIWKQQAEARAREALITGHKESVRLPTTLVLISADVVVEAIWTSASERTWIFEIISFVEGSVEQLRQIVLAPVDTYAIPHFLVVETQGDGRVLGPGSTLRTTEKGKFELHAEVEPPTMRISLADLGSDLALDEDGDLSLDDNDISFVSGAGLLRQQLMLVLSSQRGDYKMTPMLGSNFSRYYLKYKATPHLLARFLKLEIARLASIPLTYSEGQLDSPALNAIRRVEEVEIIKEATPNQVVISARLVLQGNAVWEDRFKVYIREGYEE